MKEQKESIMESDRQSTQYVTRARVKEVLSRTRGNITIAAHMLNTTPRVIQSRVEPAFIQKLRAEATEWRLDIAESQLDKKLLAGEKWAIVYVLDRFGHLRGWLTDHALAARAQIDQSKSIESYRPNLDVIIKELTQIQHAVSHVAALHEHDRNQNNDDENVSNTQ